jgi:Na+-translocating ferredoxin:NAD+ oxidoreductase subunit G
MKTLIAKMLSIGSRLFLICLVSALLLGLLNSLTAPTIKSNREKQEKLALAELVDRGNSGGKTMVEEETIVAYYTIREDSQTTGYVLELKGTGYGGVMKLLAYYKPGGELISAKLMENKETPGLGKKAENKDYMNKFTGKGGPGQPPIPTTPDQLQGQGQEAGNTGTEYNHSTGYDFVGDFPSFWEWLFGEPKTGSQDSVTGATITFKGIANALAAGSAYVQSELSVQSELGGGE